ncbi:PE family protein [Mycobacterium paragordonae]|uniref:PE-PPE domain-containing protein n=1 Tax=Mycobacterium paragordonae TaxID=1389713 RepID=A0A4R5WZE7_9MYCO|nr:PE-PPE domain-containing protein [Mycobacterium paragordonae]MDP7737583.1 PE-PPE domain-containing protein [Mycobacterium paragordonae]TDL02464.1 PE-PPE domain-containing protein [Mycobacterium paragordonae]TDL12742.1 PE-PPE domain-containing protein [Mycobacterium paragordonae]
MSFLLAEPQAMVAAATDIEGIGATLSAASAAAAVPTSNVLAAAGDEVSAAIANLFGTFGLEYQDVVTQFEAFHNEFQRTLAAAGSAYVQAEAAAATALGAAFAPPAQAATAAAIPWVPNDISMVMSGTGVPIVTNDFLQKANNYIGSTLAQLKGLNTPEELYPLTGVRSMYFNRSVQIGLSTLDTAVYQQITAGNSVTVFGVSQSAVISSLYMRNLAAGLSSFGATAPPANMLNFVLTGNEMNPNGGLLSRFPGLVMSSLGLEFYGSTPSDTIYPVRNYTLEYDGFADFPKYPLNLISDLNAVAGIVFVHPQYLSLTQAQINAAIPLQTSPGYAGNTEYFILPTHQLPLLQPLRAVPVIGNPLANLIEPDMRVLVNLGYGDPNYGYSTSPADLPTPFGLFPDVAPGTVFNALSAGTQQGITQFSADLQAMASQPVTAPTFALPSPTEIGAKIAALPTPQQVANTVGSIASTNYAVLLPTADIATSMVTSLPAYNAALFTQQLAQGNLVNAIGLPIAADVGLATVAGAVEFLVLTEAVVNTLKDIQSLIP